MGVTVVYIVSPPLDIIPTTLWSCGSSFLIDNIRSNVVAQFSIFRLAFVYTRNIKKANLLEKILIPCCHLDILYSIYLPLSLSLSLFHRLLYFDFLFSVSSSSSFVCHWVKKEKEKKENQSRESIDEGHAPTWRGGWWGCRDKFVGPLLSFFKNTYYLERST